MKSQFLYVKKPRSGRPCIVSCAGVHTEACLCVCVYVPMCDVCVCVSHHRGRYMVKWFTMLHRYNERHGARK